MSAEIVAVCLGKGGIPKHSVPSAQVVQSGLVGDRHRYELHGGFDRAICLLSEEVYASLREDDVRCETPGTFGENVLARGLDDARLRPGDRLRLGPEVVIEIYDIRAPCTTLKSVDRRFPDLMLGRSGWMARVIETGVLEPGMPIVRVDTV
ncbi:6-N-hydroxylaminopurine resistance protein [Planctomycetes bacterium Poly30]|uniref:6-N-hydroxylaminopurine resistance protein n=1 Tax=Saltatorellus ferox TaxID=2528018 RepID=A0A518F0F2_9BACT|nr:6-N-hydroxylaminopurine resistance protein [Planctomycetes bacterium Poly30]